MIQRIVRVPNRRFFSVDSAYGVTQPNRKSPVSKLLRGLAAGYGAKKMGGGCLSTILIFILLWWLLGNFEIFQ